MKIAPLIAEIDKHDDLSQVLVHTGQHYDENMSKVFFDDLQIPRPDINLNVGSMPREEMIAAIIERFRPLVAELKPDAVLVVGDVNSTIACATVAKEHHVAVVHVEAGLRSFDMSMPEEINRIETDKISDYLFITEPSGLTNLANEGVCGKAFLLGNVMIDTLIKNVHRAAEVSTVLQDYQLTPGAYVASTFHRPSNVDTLEDLTRVMEVIEEVAAKLPLVLPLHPRTKNNLEKHGLAERFYAISGLVVTEPLGYLDFLQLVSRAKLVVTDGGGIQEETTYLGVPCITMRENTERPVTVDEGTNVPRFKKPCAAITASSRCHAFGTAMRPSELSCNSKTNCRHVAMRPSKAK
jgi:UDP-N-acetylglucosamine 2-epimerase (non-hydrolysing)